MRKWVSSDARSAALMSWMIMKTQEKGEKAKERKQDTIHIKLGEGEEEEKSNLWTTEGNIYKCGQLFLKIWLILRRLRKEQRIFTI